LLDEIDPDKTMEYAVETRVGFGDLLPGVFGSTDLMGRIGNKAIILDWKFGAGVPVPAEENEQLMFYAAAAMRTPEAKWVFDGATEVELVIIQPPTIKRWTTTIQRIKEFEQTLVRAVKLAQQPDAPLKNGDHCRWCSAKPVCPVMTGAVDRAVAIKMDAIDVDKIGAYLHNADLLEAWIKDLRTLAEEMMKKGKPVKGWKMVPKRATRSWVKEEDVVHWLDGKGLEPKDIYSKELLSPAQMEKVLKKRKLALPDDLVVAVSSGTTIAPESDPRPAVVLIGQQLNAALSKLM
jgi:aldehyde:ferredoxin oxidoreductase